MKVYVGERLNSGLNVYVREVGAPNHPLEHFVRHSPTGFECGYAGSGPSDLARCILIDHLACFTAARRGNVDDGSLQRVERVYQPFKFEVVAQLDREGFELSSEEVATWLQEHG
jgi:hypothetical protein